MVIRVRNEVEIHSRLKHPAILELYNYFEDANYVYLVVEMCHNGELNRYLKSTKTRLKEVEGESGWPNTHAPRPLLSGCGLALV